MVTNSSNGIEKLIIFIGIVSVPNRAGIPITPRLLKMLDPVTFPIARSALPFFAAITDTTSSGNDVPIAIAETAITSFPMSNIVDSSITDTIVQLAENAKKVPDPIRIKGYFMFKCSFSFFSLSSFFFLDNSFNSLSSSFLPDRTLYSRYVIRIKRDKLPSI